MENQLDGNNRVGGKAVTRIVVQLDPDGGDPTITADGPVEIVQLRHGKDLQDYDEEDIFRVPCRDLRGAEDEAVGHSWEPTIAKEWVAQVHAIVQASGDVSPGRIAELGKAGYSVKQSSSQPGKYRWFRETGGDGVSVPPRECAETVYDTQGMAWRAASEDANASTPTR